jgi:hypothetical protein
MESVSSPPNPSPQKQEKRCGVDEQGWAWTTGLTRTEAEELLDWLEANGYRERELSFQPEQSFQVRWRK